MKLKKIASLALAGVMAVSMLAGCATNKPEEKPGEGEGPVTTTSLSTEVGALVKDVPEYVTFADSDKLDNALKAAVEYAGVKDVLLQYVAQDTLEAVNNPDMTKALSDKAIEGEMTSLEDVGMVFAGTDGAGMSAYRLYAVSGNMGENAVKEMIAKELEPIIATYGEYDMGGDNWYYDYTVSVSTCTKTVNSTAVGAFGTGVGAENPSVTFVAVLVVRTAAHQ